MAHAPKPTLTDPRRKRIYYQCWRRGMREMDMILGSFADTHLADLPEETLSELEHLLDVPDQQFYRWICGVEDVPAAYRTPLYERIADVKDLPDLWAAPDADGTQ